MKTNSCAEIDLARTPLCAKSTPEEIRAFFDQDVERFSNLETGQQAVPDAPLVLELTAQCAALFLKPGARLLDLGCGAGNYTLRIMKETGPLECHLADLSPRMLERAQARIETANAVAVHTHQGDLRQLQLEDNSFDCIVASAVLHHLRDDADWQHVFDQLHRWLKPGGVLLVADVVVCDESKINTLLWRRYGRFLESSVGMEYRDKVFAHIEKEDSPRSIAYQFARLHQAGFSQYDTLHRNNIAGCYYAIKGFARDEAPPPCLEDTVGTLANEFGQNGL
jgi:tRNA (cmo5U34)-methyltransferase